MNNNEYIHRQASLFHSIEAFIQDTKDHPEEYGFNIPLQYDIIIAIYHEVNQDLRNTDDLKLHNDLCYSRMNHKHGKKKTKQD